LKKVSKELFKVLKIYKKNKKKNIFIFNKMNSVKNLKMIVGTAKTSHMLLLFTSVVLISIGVYGTIVSKEYGCDEGINIKLYKDSVKNFQKDFSVSTQCINSITKGGGDIMKDCKDLLDPFTSCMSNITNFGHNKSTINQIDRCLNDHGKGYVRCMEGGLMGLSITSIVVGVLMLLLSGYLLFM
jgi:hypothetical protein